MSAFWALTAASASGDSAPSISVFAANGFPDNADLRGRLFTYVIGASRDVALAYGERRLQSAAGPVTVRVEKRSSDFIVEFLDSDASDADEPGRGSCFIQRSNAKGNYILQARILLEDDPSCYLSLYPSGSGTRGDIVMYGAVLKKGLYFSDMLYRILLLSFSDIVDATSHSFDWNAVFKFGSKDPGKENYASEFRSALPGAAAAEQASPASAAPIALGPSSAGKVALASAPAMPSSDGQAEVGVQGSRGLRIASSFDRASSPEAFLLDLASYGARELAISPDAAPAFANGGDDPMARPALVDFPRYDSRGLPLAALRAALFLDLQSNPDSVYAVFADGIRALIVPSYDEVGRLYFAVFSGGKESSWKDLFATVDDRLKARVFRVPPASSS
jgi:hypothetical protein